MLVRIVKPSEELEKHPFVQGVLRFHESDALRRSTLALRQIDHLRDPLRPAILKAAWIKNEKKLEATFNESVEQYLEVLAAAYEQAEIEGIRAKDVEVEGEPGPLPVDAMEVEFVRITDLVPANNEMCIRDSRRTDGRLRFDFHRQTPQRRASVGARNCRRDHGCRDASRSCDGDCKHHRRQSASRHTECETCYLRGTRRYTF